MIPSIQPPLRNLATKARLPAGIFLFSVLYIVASNAVLLGSINKFVFGHIGHLLLTAVVLTGFLFIFRRDRRDLLATGLLYLLLLTPAGMISALAEPDGSTAKQIARNITDNNCWAISLSVLIMLFTASSCFFSNRLAQRVIRVLSALLWTAAIALPLLFVGYWLSHQALFSSDVLVALWQTDPAEAFEYVSYKGSALSSVLLVSAVILCVISVRTLTCRQTLKGYNRMIPMATVIMLMAAIYSSVKTGGGNATLDVFRTTVAKIEELDSFKHQLEHRKVLIASLDSIKHQGRPGLFVVIIGESQTRDRMSAYGYERETTPWLSSKRHDQHFVLMENSYSCYPQTVQALGQALTSHSQFSSQSLAESPSIVEIANAAGYEVIWLSNQNRLGNWDTPTTVIANQAGLQVWLNSNIGKKIQSQHFDDALLWELAKIPSAQDKKSLVFLHVLGCHSDYRQRYPSSFDIWRDDTGAYDNAVRFSDDFTRRVYELVKDRPDFQALVFMSDHGEYPTIGHTTDPFKWSMVRIPLWAAFSNSFEESASETVRFFAANANKPFTNDMFFDMICGLLDIKNHPYYEKRNDPASSDFNRPVEMLSTVSGKFRIVDDPNLSSPLQPTSSP